ncbi:Tfp pilus assembly protein FimT-like protein (fragment) [Burkholderiales bacterium]
MSGSELGEIRETFSGRRWHAARGVTAVEVMIVVAILAVIMAMAGPTFSVFVGKNGNTAAESEFVNALNFTRSEALRRGTPVVITASAPVAGNGFGNGWTIWVDANANGIRDVGEPVVRSRIAFTNGVVLGDGTVTQIAFNQQGYLTSGAALQVKSCSSAAPGTTGYLVTILPGGITDVQQSVACP